VDGILAAAACQRRRRFVAAFVFCCEGAVFTSGGARVFAARGKRLVAAPPIGSAIDIFMVTTMSLARTVTNNTLAKLVV